MKRTKIVCTTGPSCDDIEILTKMMKAGMDVARLNFSHGDYDEHAARVALIRDATEKVGKNVALMLDTKGPEVRLGLLEKPVFLHAGQLVALDAGQAEGKGCRLPVLYRDLPRQLAPGVVILVADGLIELKVISIQGNEILCEVVHGGEVSSHKGVSVPDVFLDLPPLSEQDKKDILFGVEQGFDFIAASFIRKASDVLAIRRILKDAGAEIDIIAKIETREGVNNIEEIVEAADGVMVARGDLGVGIHVEEVPLVQKTIIKICNRAGKPVITATQMLESMIHNPRPTRAEASDVANAILDGTDAVMLSGETAMGQYPVEAVKVMARIAAQTEEALPHARILESKSRELSHTVTDAISYSTCAIAQDLRAAAVITSTKTGHTAKMVSKYRPRTPIIAATSDKKVLRKLALVWGVESALIKPIKDADHMIFSAIEVSQVSGVVKPGDLVVITAGLPVWMPGTTNMLKVHIVADPPVRN